MNTTITGFFSTEIIKKMGLSGLHCGSGQNFQDSCLNTDDLQIIDPHNKHSKKNTIVEINNRFFYLQHDAREKFPISSNIFEWIYSEHFIEHITLKEAVQWLREMYRLLKSGGFIRISTPDLRLYINGYMDPNKTFFRKHQQNLSSMGYKNPPQRPAWMLNQIFRFWGHQWLYDLDELKLVANAAGFSLKSFYECSFLDTPMPKGDGILGSSKLLALTGFLQPK